MHFLIINEFVIFVRDVRLVVLSPFNLLKLIYHYLDIVSKKLKIIFFQPDFSSSRGCNYQNDFFKALEEYHEVFPFGPGYSYYQKNHQLNDVLKIAKFTPDLICFGAGWEWEGIWVIMK